ncbi:MAG: S9 family peptidase [Patescibacteria group bacterium]
MVRKLTIRELVTLPSFYAPTVSWNKDKVAFYQDVTGRIELYILDLCGLGIRQVSNGELPKTIRTGPIWSRDDRYVIVTRDRDGDEQHDIYAFDLVAGEFFSVTQSPGQNYPAEMSPDNKEFLFLSTRDDQLNLYVLSWENKEVRRMTEFSNPVFDGTWSHDGEWIYFPANESQDLRNVDVYRVRRNGSDLEKFWNMRNGSREDISEISPCGHWLGINSDAVGINQPGVMNLDTKEIFWLGDGVHEEYAPRFSPDGKLVLTTINVDATLSPCLYDLGARTKLQDPCLPAGVVSSGQFVENGDIFFVHSDPTHRPRMLMYHPTEQSHAVLFDAYYGSVDRESFSSAEYVSYRSFDEIAIYGVLWKPKGMQPGKNVPAVIFIHGGPGGQDFVDFDLYAQVLCCAGFAVFQPNYRSSMGYGKEFFEANLKDWGGGDLQDIVHAADYLKSLCWVDKDRITVAGGSYGGYLTYIAMVAAPEIWKAGIAWMGITDLRKLYDSSMPHFKYILRYFMGDPEENAELWRNRSAITHAANLAAPLLIIHGVSDPRCPIEQARLFRDKLIELNFNEGEHFEYEELIKEGHGSVDQEQKIRIFELMAGFLERKAK